MKTDFQTIKKTNPAEVIMTLLVLGLITSMALSGMHLIGIVEIPARALPYIGGSLLSFLVIGGFIIVHNSVKFMLKKG